MDNILFRINYLAYKQLSYKDINIMKNKINFIIGESGCGKSTLLKLLNTSISPSSGEVYYNGNHLDEYNPIELRQEVSLISQDAFLFNDTILENFNMFYSLRNLTSPSEDYIKSILEVCCIDLSLDKMSSTLSGGERQRIYIALFLSFCPKVLLLDEPTSALDEKNSHTIIKNIIIFCKERNIDVVIVSHDKSIVETFCENKIEIIKERNNE